jgi:hypothetical protein
MAASQRLAKPLRISSEHDPQKHGPAKAGLDTGFAKRSCLNKRLERRLMQPDRIAF